MNYFISIYGPSKKGRSTLASTAPGPLMVVDYHGNWNHVENAPPIHTKGKIDGIGDGLLVPVTKPAGLEGAIDWALANGDQIGTFVLDNLTRLQQDRLIELTGGPQNEPTTDHYRALSSYIGFTLGQLQALKSKCNVVVVLDEIIRLEEENLPNISGRQKQTILGISNLLGYLKVTDSGKRQLLIADSDTALVGTNLTPLTKKHDLAILNPNISTIISEVSK